MILLDFETWKKEFAPRIYEDSGAWCYDHEEENKANPADWCGCEFLYTFLPDDEEEGEELKTALAQNRVWSWYEDGRILSGMHPKADYLITEKPYKEETEVR